MPRNPADHLTKYWWQPGEAPRTRGTTGKRFLKASTIIKELAGNTMAEVFDSTMLRNASPELRKKVLLQVIAERLAAAALGIAFDKDVSGTKRAQLSCKAIELLFKLSDDPPPKSSTPPKHAPALARLSSAERQARNSAFLADYIAKRGPELLAMERNKQV